MSAWPKTDMQNAIDVAIFEPLVTLHAVPENDNVKMNAVIHVFGGIADGCNCAIDLCHHTRKLLAGVEEYNSDDGRGASAVRDGVRGSRDRRGPPGVVLGADRAPRVGPRRSEGA